MKSKSKTEKPKVITSRGAVKKAAQKKVNMLKEIAAFLEQENSLVLVGSPRKKFMHYYSKSPLTLYNHIMEQVLDLILGNLVHTDNRKALEDYIHFCYTKGDTWFSFFDTGERIRHESAVRSVESFLDVVEHLSGRASDISVEFFIRDENKNDDEQTIEND